MKKKLLVSMVIIMLSFLGSCVSEQKIGRYLGQPMNITKPKLRVRFFTILVNKRVEINNYFSDLLIIQLKNNGLEKVRIVNKDGDLDLVLSDDRNYVSLRAVDRNGVVRFVTVFTGSNGAKSSFNQKSYRKILQEMSGEFIAWLLQKESGA